MILPDTPRRPTLRDRVSRLLDARIDETAIDERKTAVARAAIVVLASLLVAVNIGAREALAWAVLVFGVELWCAVATRRLVHAIDRVKARRAGYLVSALALTLGWTCLPILFWSEQVPALNVAALLVLTSQLIHAQAFAYRSPVSVAIKGGIPATVLLILPWAAGPYTPAELTTITVATLLAIGYTAASIRANLRTSSSLRRAQDELERFAYFDALTSLANRRLFTEHLSKLIDLSRRRRSQFALLLLDLDQFKNVNDTLGHDAGDALLVAVGARLRHIAGRPAHVARLGGDEFAILLPEIRDATAIDAICQRIADSFKQDIVFNGSRIVSSSSVGIAIFPVDGDGHADLYKSADLALYKAKHSGRSTWRYSNRTDRIAAAG